MSAESMHGRAEALGERAAVQRPLKLVFLGAGSGFLERLFVDVLSIPGAGRGELALVDIDTERLELAEKLCQRIVAAAGVGWTVSASADRRQVLAGADYVINCIEVSGLSCVRLDYDIPARHGVDQCIGDTTGPGGLMKALRTAPVFLEMLADVEALCPGAWVLNYTNPMSILCLCAARASPARVVGLCHSVQATSHVLASYAGIPYPELRWRCAGVNHLAWFTELTHEGRDLYPVLHDKARARGETYEQDPVRFDVMLHFGCFVTESSGHLSEYLPYYRKRPDLLRTYCRDGYRGGSGFYADSWPGWRAACDERRRRQIAGDEPIATERSWEYASFIIEAIETNRPFVAHATVPNRGLIDNLPRDGVVELACLVDARGIAPARFGPLPPQCAALCAAQMQVYELAATACLERSREAAIHALMLDPLTAAVCAPAEIRQMAEELLAAQRAFLPELR